MAWIDLERTGIYQVGFRYAGRRFKRSLGTRDKRVAEAMRHRVEENIRLVACGRLVVPPDADVPAYLISDGIILDRNPSLQKQILIGELFDFYRKSLPSDALAPETLRVCEIHMNHVVRILGGHRQLRCVQNEDLQRYVNKRSSETGKRKRKISSGTVKKEVSTFRTLWRWAKQLDYVCSDFPSESLRFPRERQRLPFSTWEQIELRIGRGIPEAQLEADYWDCLYLNNVELDELVAHVKKSSEYDFLHPMTLMAAHTGVRRSELCRSLRDDVDFESGSILVREKKRVKGKESFRHVPMSSQLRNVLSEWFIESPLSAYTFPTEYRVSRLRNGNRRENSESVSPDEASHHLERTLAGSRWERIRGWHVFRHSFISNCASRAVDQRMIDAWVGHQTEEMRRRYRHLFPTSQRRELEKVFG